MISCDRKPLICQSILSNYTIINVIPEFATTSFNIQEILEFPSHSKQRGAMPFTAHFEAAVTAFNQ